ncbi:hypothetical protein CEXT_267341 [Caerostris extrusa]|uniref:Uncharacterized protein n=1 Tax=Caerostris extrusa TaxID=172846 RepID=A0AAV4R280_CAEEX|nr:hypothetical protein CEXT_267341 [Caerostris extrusa]
MINISLKRKFRKPFENYRRKNSHNLFFKIHLWSFAAPTIFCISMVAAAARGTNHPGGKYERRKWINRRDLGHFHPFQDAILQTFVSPGTFIIADFSRMSLFL